VPRRALRGLFHLIRRPNQIYSAPTNPPPDSLPNGSKNDPTAPRKTHQFQERPWNHPRRTLQLLRRNVKRFRGGLVFKALRLFVSHNSRLESNNQEEEEDPPVRAQNAPRDCCRIIQQDSFEEGSYLRLIDLRITRL